MLAACGQKKSSLPLTRPADLMLNYHLDGGMNDYTVDIKILRDSCYYYKRNEGKVMEKRIKLSSNDLDTLYISLKSNDFDKIEYTTQKDIIYDRGGISMTVSWSDKKITVSNAQNSSIKDNWYEKWKAVSEGVDEMISRKVK